LKRRGKKQQDSKLSWILYILLAAIIVMYAISGSPIFGLISLLLIVFILIFEVKTSIKKEGTKRSIIDVVSAVGAALVVWAILIFLLHTSAPVDAVSSCSMLPALHRGDLILLHGINNISQFISSKHVPVVNVTPIEFQNMQNGISNEFLAYFAYFNGNRSSISYVINSNAHYSVGLYSTQCLSRLSNFNEQNLFYQCYVPDQAQNENLVRYGYSIGKLTLNTTVFDAVYTSQISIGNTTLKGDQGNPIVIYETTSKDAFSGSIVHRVYALLNVSGSYYFLTKGDNNQALDMEFGNYPANQSSVLGYVIADIPMIGYVKLLLSGQIMTPEGCNQVLSSSLTG
jgi:signal peptidase I